jgi:predicted Fe-S protein YdhL (DUF1289 family)
MTNQTTIPSPCVDICALDENDVCIGCFRHGREISYWGDYKDSEKLNVLANCQKRAEGETANPVSPKN